MFNSAFSPEFAYYNVFSILARKNAKKVISQTLMKMQHFESVLFDLRNIRKEDHYFLLDENSDFYDPDYEKRVLSPHAQNIYFLSLIIEEFLEDSIENPINLFCQLENLICSPQFYRNILINKKSENISVLLEKLIKSLDNSITILENNKNKQNIYSNFLLLIKKTDQIPNTLELFLKDLEETNNYFRDILKEANTIQKWY
jgi:hypothetical protein